MRCCCAQVEIALLQLRSSPDAEGAVDGLERLARVAWADDSARELVETHAGGARV